MDKSIEIQQLRFGTPNATVRTAGRPGQTHKFVISQGLTVRDVSKAKFRNHSRIHNLTPLNTGLPVLPQDREARFFRATILPIEVLPWAADCSSFFSFLPQPPLPPTGAGRRCSQHTSRC